MFTIKFGVTLLYSVPSMILYLLTILIVRRFSKDFSVTFTKLYIAFFVFVSHLVGLATKTVLVWIHMFPMDF